MGNVLASARCFEKTLIGKQVLKKRELPSEYCCIFITVYIVHYNDDKKDTPAVVCLFLQIFHDPVDQLVRQVLNGDFHDFCQYIRHR